MPALLALALLAGGCRTLDAEGAILCPSRLPARRWVAVDRVGESRWHEPGIDCGRFRPTRADVARYLARAERTDAGSLHHALPESPCIARGRVAFADGRRGSWTVDRFGNMRLAIGRAAPMLLYRARCRFGGFEQ